MTTYTFDENIVSDLHKDAHGFRPRETFWGIWEKSSDDEKQIIWDGLFVDLEHTVDNDRAEYARAVASFENKVAELITLGASDRKTAIRWIVESLAPDENDLMYGGGWVCFELGLPYNMEEIFSPICKELLIELAQTEE